MAAGLHFQGGNLFQLLPPFVVVQLHRVQLALQVGFLKNGLFQGDMSDIRTGYLLSFYAKGVIYFKVYLWVKFELSLRWYEQFKEYN